MSAKCKHLSICDEAYRGSDLDDMERVPAYLCLWATHKLTGSPTWFRKRVGGGELITDPKVECATCQAFEKSQPT